LDNLRVKIRRQASAGSPAYWEEFSLGYRRGMNVIIVLQDIQKDPVTSGGREVAPVSWECSCLEEVCGACAMVINGHAMQACSALVDKLGRDITIEPLTKFPVVRDLVVDRSAIFDNMKKVKAWIPIDGTHGLGPGPRMSMEEQGRAYPLSRCITCGCCLEACPQFNRNSAFMGAAVLNQVTLMNSHPTGKMTMSARLRAVDGPGGLAGCGNAQNCARVCPKGIPLVESIARLNRHAILDGIKGWLGR